MANNVSKIARCGWFRPGATILAATLSASAPAAAQLPAASPQLGLAASLQRSYNQMKRFITTQAERMPEGEYGFKPAADIRTFGQLVGHIADYNYIFCAPARGGVNPMAGTALENTPSKARLLEVLATSFAFCDGAFDALTDASALEMVSQGANQVTRAGSLVPVLVHGYEEYGYSAVYARLRGVVPPSTAP
jgi:hypothetical protein